MPSRRFRPPLSLRSRDRFLANPKTLVAPRPRGDAVSIVAAYVGAYCSGMAGRASPGEVLRELRRQPDPDSQAGQTVRWLLGSIRVREAGRLVASCGVPIANFAEHLRVHGMLRRDLIGWINQFAEPCSLPPGAGSLAPLNQ